MEETVKKAENYFSENVIDGNFYKLDCTAGTFSPVASALALYAMNKQSLCFQPNDSLMAPIDPTEIYSDILENFKNSVRGKRFLAKGPEKITWAEYVKTVEDLCGTKIIQNGSLTQKIISPLSNNLFSEYFYCQDIRNLAQFINQYKEPTLEGSIAFNGKNKLKDSFQGFNATDYVNKDSFTGKLAKRLFYV